jgi:hypothetical protein
MPGEEDMHREFTAALKPRLLGQLVDVVFEKMKLAGEAGSLLKIEEELKDAVAMAWKQWMEVPKPEQQLLFPGLSDPRLKQQEFRFDLKGITDKTFMDRAEEEIINALRTYAEKASNGRAYRKRLFAEDAARGFAFVDLCLKHYDVVLMNPPYGEGTALVKVFLDRDYARTRGNVYAAFIELARDRLHLGGMCGALTERMWAFQPTFRAFREDIILPTFRPTLFADLMYGVLDEAFNRTAAYVLIRESSTQAVIEFLDVRRCTDKNAAIQTAIGSFHDPTRYLKTVRRISQYPGAMFLYSLPPLLERLFLEATKVVDVLGTTAEGRQTSGDERFVRVVWEVPLEAVASGEWISFAKGGDNLPFLRDSAFVVRWDDHSKSHYLCTGSRRVADSINKFKIGWSDVASCLVFQGMPIGQVTSPANQGLVTFDQSRKPWGELGYLNTRIPRAIAAQYYDGHHWQPGIVGRIPFPSADLRPVWCVIEQDTEAGARALVALLSTQEETRFFASPAYRSDSHAHSAIERLLSLTQAVDQYLSRINEAVEQCLNIETESAEFLREALSTYDEVSRGGVLSECTERALLSAVVSYSLGAALGRWDIRLATGERQPPELPDPFDPLPVCPPGMLQGPDGLPAKPEDVPPDYPIRIDWDGILVDDPGHEDDIISRVQDVLEVIWKDRAEAIEREACEILGVKELRDYFRKPGNGGFWMDHVRRYSKSRRKAPIYWYLRSARGNYGLWLYYHRLDKDILFKALLNYVEPKIRMEEDRLKSLRGRKEAAGSSGREAKQIEKDIDRQEQFVSELHDFADRLRRAANLHLVPDLNDGVVLTIAPLFELVPWKEAKEYWEDLVEGKYEWSCIGKQMREKGLVKK